MKKKTDQSQKNLYLEYQSVFAPMGRHIMNRARLVGREAERNIAQATGQAEKLAKMAPHVFNPLTDFSSMNSVAKQMDQEIEQRLNNIDSRYSDVIEALKQSAGNSDLHTLLAMLSPGLYFGSNVVRNAPAQAATVINALTGQRATSLPSSVSWLPQAHGDSHSSSVAGHPALAGGVGGGDSGDSGGYFESVENDLIALNEKGEVVPNQQQATSLQQQMKNPAVIKAFQDIQNAAIDQLASSFSAKLKIQNLQPEARKAEVQKFLNLWLPKIQSPNGKKRLQIRVSPLMK